MNRAGSLLRFLLLTLAAGLRSLLRVPARFVAALDHAVVSRAPGAAAFPVWFLVLLVTHLFDRRAAAAGLALILVIVLLLFLP